MTSLGESGLPVFHAGHCDWQRPHSVQVVKSSRPFQVKFSTWPTPNTSSSPGVLEVDELAAAAHRLDGAERHAAVGTRLKKRFGNAVNRCQATPAVASEAMNTNHAIDTTIFAVATARTALRSVSGERSSKSRTSGYETQCARPYQSTLSIAPRSRAGRGPLRR
jgi:hypothetical protein